MELFFTCPACGKRLKVKGTAMGGQVGCPGCQRPVTVPRGEFAPGTRIGGFEVVRPLGKGGMGEVYLARQLAMGREVALKVLSAEFAAKPEARERFLKEVRVAAKLEHPHIVTAHDAGEDDNLCYMAMSFVPAESLAARLKPGTVMGEREALAMTRKLAQALDYAWTRFHIIHRDIKPANILFDADGEPKLADMGLSKSLDDAEAMTMSGAVMGTPNYMSPEQAEGASDLDLRADIYSLGATLYHALTGQMPFAGSSIMAVLRRQAVEILPDPREFNPELSEHCVGLLQIMLAKKREDRYGDWKALIKDIDGVLDAKPPSIALPGEGRSVLIRKGTGHGAHKKIVIPKGGLHHEKPAPAPAPPAPKKAMKPRDKALVFGGVAAVVLAALAVGLVMHLSKQRAEERRVAAQREEQQAAQVREREGRAAAEKTQAEIWQVAADFAKANPGAFDRAMANFEDAGKRLAGTKYELMAKNEVERLRTERKDAAEKAFGELDARARELAGRKDFNGAAEVFAKYGGPFAADLAARRAAAEQGHREAALAELEKLSQAERDAKQREQVVITAVAEAVSAGDLGAAQQTCKAFLDDPAVTIDKSAVRRIAGWLEAAAGADRALLATFEAQKGKEVILSSGAAKVPVRVLGVRGDRIQIEQKKGVGWASAELALAQIPFEERQARLAGKLDPAALGLWNGMAYSRARRPDLAAEAFKATGELATLLLARAEGAKSGEREAAAGAAFAQALQAAGLPAEGLDPAAVAARFAPGKMTMAQAAAALRQLDAYAAAFGDTQHAKTAAKLTAALRPVLEAAQKGVVAPVPAAPKIDDFAKRVLAARAYTGEVVRCSPEGGDGTLPIAQAVRNLKSGMVLRVMPGTYEAIPMEIPVNNIVIEGNPAASYSGTLALRFPPGGSAVFRSLWGRGLLVGSSKETRGEFIFVDSRLHNLTIYSDTLRLFNCWLGGIWLGGDTDADLRHCTIRMEQTAREPQTWFQNVMKRCLISDSLIWNETAPPFVAKTGYSNIFLALDRCVSGSPVGLSAAVKSDGGYEFFGDLSAFPAGRMKACVTVGKTFLDEDGHRLAKDSPGKGIAAGGRDPGALLDEKGNILPLDPVPPAASSAPAASLAPTAPTASPAKADDFARDVLAARAYTGEVIRCSPEGGDGVLPIAEAVRKLRKGMILRLLPGSYPDEKHVIPADDVVIEGSPSGTSGYLSLEMESGVFRSLSGLRLSVGSGSRPAEDILVVDSRLKSTQVWAERIRWFNVRSWGGYFGIGQDIEVRHCTLRADDPTKAAHWLFNVGIVNVRISDSLLWNDESPPLWSQRFNSNMRLLLERCVMGSNAGLTATEETGQDVRPFKDLSVFRDARMKDCITAAPVFLDAAASKMAPGSPGKGIAAGGRDPGALLDENGNILPLDPVAPAAAQARPGVAAKPDTVTSPAASSAPKNGATWISLDLHPGFNADFISTGARAAADPFSATSASNSTWGTASYVRRHRGAEGPGLPEDGRIAIAGNPPGGFWELEVVSNRNAILITAPEGRQGKAVRIDLTDAQRGRYARFAVLHGGAWGDGQVTLTVEYEVGPPTHHVLAIRDWVSRGRSQPLPADAWPAAQVSGSGGTAEMFGQALEPDSSRAVRALRFAFDSCQPPKVNEGSARRLFTAAVFAVSALPATTP